MNDYLIRYHTEAGIKLEETIAFNMPQSQKIIIHGDIKKDERDVPIKFGIWIDVTCKAEDIDSAINSSEDTADSLMSLFCLSHQTWTNPVDFVSGINTSPGSIDREFVQNIPLPFNIMPSRKYKNDVLSPVWDTLMKLKNDKAPWLLRSIRWYRKAILESETLDQFMNLWTGLETLNKLIKNKYSLPKERPIRICPNCDTPVSMEPTLAGIEYLILNIQKLSPAKWKSIRDTRLGLMHGFENLSKLSQNAKDLIPDMQSALLLGIFDILDVPTDDRIRMKQEPLKEFTSPTLKVRVILHQLPYEKLADGTFNPHFVLDTIGDNSWIEPDGTRTETKNLGLRIMDFQGNYTPVFTEIYGKKLPEDVKAKFNLESH
jgi:hypothetical protein